MEEQLKLNIQLLKNAVNKPSYGSTHASGFDLNAGISTNIVIPPKESKIIPTGIIIEIPSGYEGQLRSRSGLASKNAISVLNSPGTIDSDYRGEIKVILINLSAIKFFVLPGMRIAQLIIAPTFKVKFNYVKKISTFTKRGKKGFGSTGL
jgi:dUTP pyrophosphatase